MTDGTNISREELLELATADALGVIDEVDSARFEKAFLAASPSVQADIRALQDRIACDPNLLANEQPPASLRLKTLARVAASIEEHAAAPIATIGPTRARADGRGAIDRDAIVREILERTALERRPTQHVWRAAALFLFAALVVALYFEAQQRQISARLMDFVDRRIVDDARRSVALASSTFDFKKARELKVLDEFGNRASLVHAFLDEDSGRVCVYGVGIGDAGQVVRVSVGGGNVALETSVIEDRGFAVICERPATVTPLRVDIGKQVFTVVL
ncbi:MAG: hypothetical protein RLZZ116_1608 [Planctomycetota bacterium]|jgi:hypothetical protein